jgi:hypothetical protein
MKSATRNGGDVGHRIGRLTPLAHSAAEAAAATAMTMNVDVASWRGRLVLGGMALALLSARRRVPVAAGLALVGVAAYRRMRRRDRASRPVEGSVTIGRSAAEVEACWRDARLFRASGLPFSGAGDPDIMFELRPAPGQRGTELAIRVDDARLLGGGSSAQARLVLLRGLRAFKSLVETGEAPTISGQPSARADRQ